MKQIILPFLSAASVFVLSLFWAQPAAAHGGDPRIEIGAERLNPGAVLNIRGVDFEFEEQVSLSLMGAQGEIPLGTVVADTEGVFLATVTLPADLAEGVYVIRATLPDTHVVESPPITVWGAENSGDSEDGQRSEEDLLLAPMPTVPPGPYPTSLPQTTASATPASNGSSTILIYSIVAGIGILALLGIRILKKR